MNGVIITLAFSIMAFLCFCGMVAERDSHLRKHCTICFGICATLIFAVNILGGLL